MMLHMPKTTNPFFMLQQKNRHHTWQLCCKCSEY